MNNSRRYHEQEFPADLNGFFNSLEIDVRNHSGGGRVGCNSRFSFRLNDLMSSDDYFDHLKHIDSNNFEHFATSLMYVVVINQIFHSHFNNKHQEFWDLTRYPLLAGGLNPSTSAFRILDDINWENRGANHSDIVRSWKELTQGMQADLVEFFDNPGRDLDISWLDFKEAVLGDEDISSSQPWGEIIIQSI